MYILNVASAIEKIIVIELRDFAFENCYKGIEFVKESSYYSVKRLKKFVIACNYINRKIADSSNAKEYYSSYLKRKNKISKTIKND